MRKYQSSLTPLISLISLDAKVHHFRGLSRTADPRLLREAEPKHQRQCRVRLIALRAEVDDDVDVITDDFADCPVAGVRQVERDLIRRGIDGEFIRAREGTARCSLADQEILQGANLTAAGHPILLDYL